METINLSDTEVIYRSKYSGIYTQSDFLKKVEINSKYTTQNHNNSTWIEIETPEFSDIENQIKKILSDITKTEILNYSKHTWIYSQKKNFNLEWMHQHLLVHPDNRSTIHTDYTFTYYIQTPTNSINDEGNIVFETTDRIKHNFLPEEGDIFIFPADLRHTAIPTPNCDKERIVMAGSFCLDVFNQRNVSNTLI